MVEEHCNETLDQCLEGPGGRLDLPTVVVLN